MKLTTGTQSVMPARATHPSELTSIAMTCVSAEHGDEAPQGSHHRSFRHAGARSRYSATCGLWAVNSAHNANRANLYPDLALSALRDFPPGISFALPSFRLRVEEVQVVSRLRS